MRNDKKILIVSALNHLQERDPAWKHPKMFKKFKFLYDGWAVSEVRNNKRTRAFYTISWKRGWLPVEEWKRFREYAMQ